MERIRQVADRMGLVPPPFAVITVGGTNGKGSTVTFLTAILHAAGYRVGTYTSPHLIRYNERIQIDAQPVEDRPICESFARIDAARGEISLTYFEFGTLAAIDLFREARVDIAVLEVGLGGRLDAVNVWDPDVAVVTAIGIDHTEWLGPDRESIGREKAGIFRAGRPAVVADADPPTSLLTMATERGAQLYRIGHEFDFRRDTHAWSWRHAATQRVGLPYPSLRGDYQLHNASAALMALACLAPRFPVDQAQVRVGLTQASLPGRFQTLPGLPLRVLDVAHNAHAAAALAATLKQQRVAGKTLAVVGMLKDKPIAEVFGLLAPCIDAWYLADLDSPRGASAEQLAAALAQAGIHAPAERFANPLAAYRAACGAASDQDRVVVFGSFYTVGGILAAHT